MSGGQPLLEARGVSFCYPHASRPAFEPLDLALLPGTMLALLGNNGAGKSTLLSVLSGMESPTEGAVLVGSAEVARMSRREAARHIAFVAQQQSIPHLSVYDEVLLGRRPHLSWSLTERDRAVAVRSIRQLGLERLSCRCLDELSGGERQKAFIARALAQDPEVLLLDEPTSALDPRNQVEVLEAVRDLTRSEGLATVLVIHDLNLALRFCDQFLLLRDGRVVARGGGDAMTEAALEEAYGIGFCRASVDGIPVALPLSSFR